MYFTFASTYDVVSDVVESGGHWRSNFQIGSRVLKHCQRHNGPRIMSAKLELYLKAETNANSNLAL